METVIPKLLHEGPLAPGELIEGICRETGMEEEAARLLVQRLLVNKVLQMTPRFHIELCKSVWDG